MKLSIIVVTWNNENYIEQCLKSCISDTDLPYEVIVVHNASTDRTGSMIRRAIQGYEHLFKIIENEQNEGLGEARNIGMSHANGEYLTFLDGDDFYKRGSIAFILEKTQAVKTDVVLFDYEHFWPTGAYSKNRRASLLAPERDISDPQQRAKIIPSMGVAWNKAYRAAFIKKLGLKFTRRYYEDIDWHFSCIFNADSYYVTPQTCVVYRHRLGSITKSFSMKHFDIIDQYEDVLEMLNTDELKNNYGLPVYKYARGQILNVFNSRERLPRDAEARYLKEASVFLKKLSKHTGVTRPDRLVQISSLGIPVLNTAARRANRFVKNTKRNIAKFVRGKLVSYRNKFYKHILLKQKLDPKLAVFESYWGDKIDCNPAALASRLSQLPDWKVVWILKDPSKHQIPANTTAIKRGSFLYYRTIARAAFFVSNVNFASNVIKRDGAIFLQTFHGTPIKTMGLDLRQIKPKEMNWADFRKRSSRWDYGISSNPYSSEIWRQSHPFEYTIIETGYPRNDALFSNKNHASICQRIGIPSDKKVVLYAPTFRENQNRRFYSLDSKVIDFSEVKEALGDDWIVLFRMHHLVKTDSFTCDGIFDVSNFPNISELLQVTDLLISDYSSIIFDYACLQRPIILHTYDYEEYTSTRGVYFDIRQKAPGEVTNNFTELLSCLKMKSFESPENQEKLSHFRLEFCPWDDGDATNRVLRQVFGVKV